MLISDWSSDVCSSDLSHQAEHLPPVHFEADAAKRVQGLAPPEEPAADGVDLVDAVGAEKSVFAHRALPAWRARKAFASSSRPASRHRLDRKSTRLNSSH